MNVSAASDDRDIIGRDSRPFIEGMRVSPEGSESIAKNNPVTGKLIAPLQESSLAVVQSAVASASNAVAWVNATPDERKSTLHGVADRIEESIESIAAADSREMGKPISAARWDARIAAGYFRYYAEAIDKHVGVALPRTSGAEEIQQHRPKGVVAAITPWNFPSINAALKAAPALAAGNTLVMKPSEVATCSTLLMAEIANGAGLPEGAWNVVTGGGQIGAKLIGHPEVDMITFTGSTQTGLGIMRSVGENGLKSMLLECGGKSPALVFADAAETANAKQLSHALASAALWNCGQVCVARSRIYVQRKIYDDVVEGLIEHCSSLTLGRPDDVNTQYGPLASEAHYQRILGAIEAGTKSGATLALDGRLNDGPDDGFFVGPSIFVNAPQDSGLVQEEIFGPVITISAFDSEDEAVRLANDSQYGLAASIYTTDFGRAHRVADRINVGKVTVYSSPSECMPPWAAHSAEPVKQSGFGAEGGMAGLGSYTSLKSTQYIYG